MLANAAWFGAAGAAWAQPTPSADDVLAKIVQNRTALKAGRISIRVTYEVDEYPDNEWKSRTYHYRFLFDGRARRIDVENEGVTKQGRVGRSTEQVVFLADGTFILRPARSAAPVEVGSDRRVVGSVEEKDIDPRLVGLVPCPFKSLWKYGLDDAFESLRLGEIQIEQQTLGTDGARLRVSSTYESADGKPVANELIVDPSAGYSVSSAGFSRPDFAAYVKTMNKQWAPGVWYPHESIYEQLIAGNLVQRVRMVVEAVEPLEQVSPAEFTLGALELKEGRVVRKNLDYFIWDGANLVPHSEDQPRRVAPADLPEQAASARRWVVLLISNAVVFALIAAWFVARYYLRSH